MINLYIYCERNLITMDYNKVSRRSLIKNNEKFDAANNHILSDFYDGEKEKGEVEDVRLVEKATVKVDKATRIIKEKSSDLLSTMISTTSTTFDELVSSVIDNLDEIGDAFK